MVHGIEHRGAALHLGDEAKEQKGTRELPGWDQAEGTVFSESG